MHLLLSGIALLLSLLPDLAAVARHGAPEGYEDQWGFHFGRPAAQAGG